IDAAIHHLQRDARPLAETRALWLAASRKPVAGGPNVRRAPTACQKVAGPAGVPALRRQPAESGAQQVADDRAEAFDSRRADPGRGRWGEARGAQAYSRAGRERDGRPNDLERPSRSARLE